jgi:hypothetical protein
MTPFRRFTALATTTRADQRLFSPTTLNLSDDASASGDRRRCEGSLRRLVSPDSPALDASMASAWRAVDQ